MKSSSQKQQEGAERTRAGREVIRPGGRAGREREQGGVRGGGAGGAGWQMPRAGNGRTLRLDQSFIEGDAAARRWAADALIDARGGAPKAAAPAAPTMSTRHVGAMRFFFLFF